MAKTFNLVSLPKHPGLTEKLINAQASTLFAVEGQPRLSLTSTYLTSIELDGKQWAALAEFAAAQSLLLTDDDNHLDAHDSTEWVNR
jgi:hypothetical protein